VVEAGDAFQSAFVLIVAVAAAGALVASLAFPRAGRAVPAPSGEPTDLAPAHEIGPMGLTT
jgi:hypothetical protein